MFKQRFVASRLLLFGTLPSSALFAALVLSPTAGATAINPNEVRLADAVARQLRTSKLKFDASRGLLVAYHDSKDTSDAAVAVIDVDGRLIMEATPLKDFPQASAVDVWDAAATRSGAVLSVVIQDGRPPRHAFLEYAADGLKQVWQVSPFHHHNLAVDALGYIYAFGHSTEKEQAKNVIVKYAPDGSVVAQFLPAELLPRGSDTAIAQPKYGENSLWIDGERLMLFVAESQELLQFSLQGQLQRRVSLAARLKTFAGKNGGTRTQVMAMAPVGEAEAMVAHVGVWIERQGFSFMLLRVPLSDARIQRLHADLESEFPWGPLIGASRGDWLFLDARGGTLVRRQPAAQAPPVSTAPPTNAR